MRPRAVTLSAHNLADVMHANIVRRRICILAWLFFWNTLITIVKDKHSIQYILYHENQRGLEGKVQDI